MKEKVRPYPKPRGLSISDAKDLVLFARHNKIQSLKFGEFEFTLSPGALMIGVPIDDPELTPEQRQALKKKHEEEILYRSA